MQRLEAERRASGFSIAQLARDAGMHPTTVGCILSRRLVPYPGQMRKLAVALKWPADRAQELLEEVPENADE